MSYRPAFAKADSWLGPPILDIDLHAQPSGSYVVPSGDLASLGDSYGNLTWEIQFSPLSTMMDGTALETVFEATTAAGSFSLSYTASSGTTPDSWATITNGSSVQIPSNSATANNSPATPKGCSGLTGDDVRVYATYHPLTLTWGLACWCNGVMGAFATATTPSLASSSGTSRVPLVPITALTLLSLINGTQPLNAQIKRFRAYPVSAAVRVANVTGLVVGDSITANFDAAWTPPGIASRIYAPAESALFKAPRIGQLTSPGDTFATQTARFNASPWVNSGTVRWVYIQLFNNDIALGASTATAIARMNTLIATIRAALPGVKVLCGLSAPNKGSGTWTAGQWNSLAACNTALLAGPGVQINCDAVVSSHYAAMGDVGGAGVDYLAPSLDSGDHLHPNKDGQGINGAALRSALLALGLL